MNRIFIALIALTVVACLQSPSSDSQTGPQSAIEVKSQVAALTLTPLSAPALQTPAASLNSTIAEQNSQLAQAFAEKQSHVWLTGHGLVIKLLADDHQGARHQRFLVRVTPQQTLLFAHNIDLAPRLDALAVGDEIRFAGEYIYNPKGGVMHWTHLDPQGKRHGYIQHLGRTYQ